MSTMSLDKGATLQRNASHPSSATGSSEKYANVVDGLKSIYRNKIKPLESAFKFPSFHSPSLSDSDIDAKPMVLLLGQYSTGKTTFIQYLIEADYPGAHIGPEPTTDRFVAVVGGPDTRVIPGNAAAVQSDKPFTGLSQFGTSFLSKFQVSQTQSSLLDNLIFIDTPGVLSGEKQRLGRSYDFVNVIEWFAERADMILLLFDAHKLDISDEFKRTINALKGHDEKIRVVLNKCDMITNQQLMRVYGALMWSLGKVIQTPEVVRVYLGSFIRRANGEFPPNRENVTLLEAEQHDLIEDLMSLPRNSATRKVNEIVKRARLIKVHAHLMSHLRKEMPSMFGKSSKQRELIDNLPQEFTKVQRQFHLPPGDFPDLERFRAQLKEEDFMTFTKMTSKMAGIMEDVLSKDLPRLMAAFPPVPKLQLPGSSNPFAAKKTFGMRVGDDGQPLPFEDSPELWQYENIDRAAHDSLFYSLGPSEEGVISGAKAKEIFLESRLPNAELGRIWALSDLGKDGALDVNEFAIAMHLLMIRLQGGPLPERLPASMLPPKPTPFDDD